MKRRFFYGILLVALGVNLLFGVQIYVHAAENSAKEDPYPQYKIALLDLSSGKSPHLIEADERISSGGLSFTPDGKAVAYPIRENGVDNLWVQPLSGGSAGRQITSFNSERILTFRWSPDGKSLAILRSHTDSDVVLIRDLTK